MFIVNDELKKQSDNHLCKCLRLAWPSILSSCKQYGSKNIYEDAQDVLNDLFIKFSQMLFDPKNIELTFKNIDDVYMEYEEVKGKSKPNIIKNDKVNVLQGRLIHFKTHNLLKVSKSLKVDDLELQIDKNDNEFDHIIYDIGLKEILVDNSSAKPKALRINIFNIQAYLVTAAKNRVIDLISNKNVKNKLHDDIVIDSESEIDVMNDGARHNKRPFSSNKPVEEKIIEDIDKRRKMKMIRDYMTNEMDPVYCQVLEFHLQGIEDKKIAELIDKSHENVRKILYKARLELAKKFKENK